MVIRDRARGEGKELVMWEGGWHFTSLGGYERIVEKRKNYAHGSDEVASYAEYRQWVEEMKWVEIDTSFPRYIQENQGVLMELGLLDPA